MAPLKFLASSALFLNKSVILLNGARYKEGLYPEERLPARAEVIAVIENGNADSKHKKGLVTDILGQYVDWADQIFACGPQAMYAEIDRQLVTWQREKSVAVSLEVRMGCGFGACYGCSIKTKLGMKRVCKEGPVFNIKDIIWQEVKI
jgi:dihydroorotate dehydrogenase electron transfer subunit